MQLAGSPRAAGQSWHDASSFPSLTSHSAAERTKHIPLNIVFRDDVVEVCSPHRHIVKLGELVRTENAETGFGNFVMKYLVSRCIS
jgi:hypothetical protein